MSNKKETLNSLSRAELSDEDFTAFFDEMNNGSDRAAALIAVASLQSELTHLVRTKLVHDDRATMAALQEQSGPLSGFYATIQLAYALGLISKSQKRDLDTIRRIRNVFAHSQRPLTFKTPSISREVENLRLGKDFLDIGDLPLTAKTSRDRFIQNTLHLQSQFTLETTAHHKRRRKRAEAKIRRLKKQVKDLSRQIPELDA